MAPADNGRDWRAAQPAGHGAVGPTQVSDAEAKARADFDIRWKVALGIEIEDRPFATLQLSGRHEKVQVFESSRRSAVQT